MRNALSLVPKAAQQMVGATIRTVFAQPERESAREQWRRVADGFRPRFPKLAELMDGAEDEVLAYAAFPVEHWQKVWSNNPLERLNKEVKRSKPAHDVRDTPVHPRRRQTVVRSVAGRCLMAEARGAPGRA